MAFRMFKYYVENRCIPIWNGCQIFLKLLIEPWIVSLSCSILGCDNRLSTQRLWEGGKVFFHLSGISHRARSVVKATNVAWMVDNLHSHGATPNKAVSGFGGSHKSHTLARVPNNPSQKSSNFGQAQKIWLRVPRSRLHLGQFPSVPGKSLATGGAYVVL